ncbi:deoxyuridine triphosphate nucleotidohydrolase/Deoxycytidine triphosphate deaminase [Artemisia annua]|uniref:Deoxyuridine 5'-triphosphate nucleotidohydrolase n=1 Tax=Artemisia annua TaxID=35608 RepID=A0A2U1M1P4_ARTAN|nr:deoxyuridine triphosphate nucleotidohydrolase/Deoxycytidine triphosphate deaminase [Artemisia annua]
MPMVNMAGIFGAITRSLPPSIPLAAKFTCYKPPNLPPNSHSFQSFTFHCSSKSYIMANNTNGTSEIVEPVAKIQKLNGNSDDQIPIFKVKKLSENAVLPTRGSSLAAGYDLSSAVEAKVPARGKALIATDLSIAVPQGTYARIAPRSGLAWKHSIDVGAGVVDADYRGPVGVILFNHSDADFEVKVGDRIAQLIIEKIITPEVIEVEDLDATVRGAGGFGSTGV